MSGVLPSSKWKLETGAYNALTNKSNGSVHIDAGTNQSLPVTFGAVQPSLSISTDNGSSRLGLISHTTYGNPSYGSLMMFAGAEGTASAPTQLLTGDVIGGLIMGGYGAGAMQLHLSGMYSIATNDWDTSQDLKLLWAMDGLPVFQSYSTNKVTDAYYNWNFQAGINIVGLEQFDASVGQKINFYSGSTYSIGIDPFTQYYDVPTLAHHEFRYNTVDTLYIGTSTSTASPYLDMLTTDRTLTNSTSLIGTDSVITLDYATAIAPIGYNFASTLIFKQNGFGFGSGALFYSHPLIQNDSASTRTIGPVYGYISQPTYQANGGTLTVGYDLGFIAQPTYNRINSGTLAITGSAGFRSAGPIIAAGATVTLYNDLEIIESSNAGTYTNHVGISMAPLTLATNNTSILMGTQATGNWGIYQSTTTPHKLNGSIILPYVAKTGTYSITDADHTVDCTSGTFTVTLPTAVGFTGRIFVVKNSGTGVITIATTSSQTIDGASTATLSTQYSSLTVQSNGSNWILI